MNIGAPEGRQFLFRVTSGSGTVVLLLLQGDKSFIPEKDRIVMMIIYKMDFFLCEMRGVSVDIKLFDFTTNECLMLE